MKYRRIWDISFDSLLTHKLRTFLTMLGVIFGVAAVIAMLSIGEGAKQEALEQISILGINNVVVYAKIPDYALSSDAGMARSPGLSLQDANNIAEFTDLVENVVPIRIEGISQITAHGEEANARVVATLPSYIYSTSIEVGRGRFLNAIDDSSFAQVCVLGATTKRKLFAFSEALGKSVRIGDLNFTVIGVMADKYIGRGKVEGFELRNLNEDVYIPLNTAVKKIDRYYEELAKAAAMHKEGDEEEMKFNIPEIDQMIVTVRDILQVGAVTKLVEKVLTRRHAEVDDYRVVVPESLLRQTQKTQQIFNIVMGAIAGISLLVGGIGIMNIMLASVLERTREIGIRRAVGATQNDVLRQFLLEAVAICLLGCVVGVALGLFLSKAVSFYAQWPTVVSFFSILLAVGVSAAVGIIFGFYPARKAAQLDVIEALRYE
jgi:putative ABC transport system permease protein